MMDNSSPEELVDYWFSDDVAKHWFNSTKAFDDQLREKYLRVYEQASHGHLDHWRDTPLGSLALIILFDQIPLNIFRGQPRSFATEEHARRVASIAIKHAYDQQLSDKQKAFMYLPFMHSENLQDQNLSVELFEKAGLKENLRFARHHRSIIERFGRFPHRNAILNRKSTAEEITYLDSPEAFHG